LRDHLEIFETAEMTVEVRLLGDVPHALTEGHEVIVDGFAIEEDLAGGHFDETGDHLHGGGFAGAVRTEVAGHLPRLSEKADVVDRGNTGVALRDVTEFEQCIPFRSCFMQTRTGRTHPM
jgi:hypothetical protein